MPKIKTKRPDTKPLDRTVIEACRAGSLGEADIARMLQGRDQALDPLLRDYFEQQFPRSVVPSEVWFNCILSNLGFSTEGQVLTSDPHLGEAVRSYGVAVYGKEIVALGVQKFSHFDSSFLHIRFRAVNLPVVFLERHEERGREWTLSWQPWRKCLVSHQNMDPISIERTMGVVEHADQDILRWSLAVWHLLGISTQGLLHEDLLRTESSQDWKQKSSGPHGYRMGGGFLRQEPRASLEPYLEQLRKPSDYTP